MQELKLPETPVARLKNITQWNVWALVRLPAIPKAGPAVDQHLCVFFLLEQPKKPSAEQIESEITEKISTDQFEIKRADIYQTSRVYITPVKGIYEPDLMPGEPEKE